MGETMKQGSEYDEIGYWSEIKLDIIKDYATEYSRILSSQKKPRLYHIYIDAFAGAGKHISKKTGEFVLGSPMNALLVKPAFREYYFIDLNKQKIASLEKQAGSRKDVHIYHGDCNNVLLEKVFPNAEYQDYRRSLCILDPYGLHLNWEVIHTAGQMKSIDMFLNFPVADMNRNVLLRKPDEVSPNQIKRMNRFWGDESWRQAVYLQSKQRKLFGDADIEKASNKKLVEAFRKRIKIVAGFRNVPEPIAMRNTQNAVVYYLFFASNKLVAENIIKYIFNKYKDRRG